MAEQRAGIQHGSSRWFRFKVGIARALGLWSYDGLRGWQPPHWPHARVYYPDVGRFTIRMALGDAIEQADRHANEGALLADDE